MNRSFRKVKACIILSIFLFSVLAAFLPSSSAGIINYESDIELLYDASAATEGIEPLQGAIAIPIWVRYKVSGIFPRPAQWLSDRGMTGKIDLTVGQTESWVTATLTSYTLNPELSTTWQTIGGDSPKYFIMISFTEEAPAIAEVKIPLTIYANEISVAGITIREKTINAEISFKPQFIPIIDVKPKKTYTEVAPGEVAVFDLELENLGNGKTEFEFQVKSKPDGWTASIVSKTFVDSYRSGNNIKHVTLQITPPYGFGYHNEQEDIIIKITARYFGESGADNESYQAKSYDYRFTVRNKGFSAPGFEAPSLLMAFVFVAVALIVMRRRKRHI